ncbi:MAG: hypothetical protein LBU22_00830 [Dysgonamonadaceae bacterium]|jgi:DNA-binding Xre family transcriptional regulator|nr:hypothetical protein [Dysgonamonadaceae bacterium]
MSEYQKNIIDRLLKEKRKTKRNLADFLKIKENSINRMLTSPNISFLRLEQIAVFLEIDVMELLPKKNVTEDASTAYFTSNTIDAKDLMISNLSEAVRSNSRTIEIMAESEKRNGINIENLVKLITKLSDTGHGSSSVLK